MPWTSADSSKHTKKANTAKLAKQWADVANSAREKCISDGGDSEMCDQKAIMMANGVIAKLSEENNCSFYYMTEIDVSSLKELEDKTTITMDVFRIGKWQHPKWGIIEGTKKLFNDFIKNFKNNVVGRDLVFDKNHRPEDGGTGIVKDLFIEGDKLKALVELTNFGIDLIKNKGFQYFSPEYTDKYTDKETGNIIENVLIGGALTLRPFLTNLSPVVLSEQLSEDIENQCFKQSNDIELKEELWLALEEYADHNEEKIKTIVDIMQEHMKEMMSEMKTKDGETMVKSIIKTHMQQMINEIMNNMDWVRDATKTEVKSNH